MLPSFLCMFLLDMREGSSLFRTGLCVLGFDCDPEAVKPVVVRPGSQSLFGF